MAGGLTGRQWGGEAGKVQMPGLLCRAGLGGAAGGGERRGQGGSQGEAGRRLIQLRVHVIVDVGEGLTGGGVGKPAPGGDAAAGAGAQGGVPVRVLHGQVQLVPAAGLRPVHPRPVVSLEVRLEVGGDGRDLDAGALEGLGARGGVVLAGLDSIAQVTAPGAVQFRGCRSDWRGRLCTLACNSRGQAARRSRMGNAEDVERGAVIRFKIWGTKKNDVQYEVYYILFTSHRPN